MAHHSQRKQTDGIGLLISWRSWRLGGRLSLLGGSLWATALVLGMWALVNGPAAFSKPSA